MKGNWKFGLLILGCVAIAYWFLQTRNRDQEVEQPEVPSSASGPTEEQRGSALKVPAPSNFMGVAILEGYGSGKPENDLQKVNSLIGNYRTLAKGMDARNFSSNADVAAALRGEKHIALAVLPKDHKLFNEEGLIVDRWGSPLFFHLISAEKVAIYSAGPDKVLGTEDDFSMVGGIVTRTAEEF
ncbi:MAG: hypothetical protein O3C43_13035 [Verrucomicrobia bacterium]|nr:hypothetical protein [Verrucomicrobiota bacterium]